MDILLVTVMVPRPRAPSATPPMLHAVVDALRARHRITLVTLAGDEPDEREALEALRAVGVAVMAAHRPATTRFRASLRRGRLGATWLRGGWPKRSLWFHEPAVQELIDRTVAARRFDLVQAEDITAGLYRFPAALPTVLTDHEVHRPRRLNWHAYRRRNPIAGIITELDWQRWPAHQRAVWRRFDRVQVFSQRDAEALAEVAPDVVPRVRINAFPIVLPPRAAIEDEIPGSLLFIGNFTHAPNVDAAMWLVREIMPAIRREYPGVRLTLLGSDPRGIAARLAGGDVAAVGFVPGIEALLDRAAVAIAPIRIGGGQRMKVLHSMAAGKATVTTRRGAAGLDVDLADPPLSIADDAEGLARATVALLRSPATRHELGRRARAAVQTRNTPAAYAARADSIYRELLAAAPGSHHATSARR